MPAGRWLITKLDLLLPDAVGHELRDVAALEELEIDADDLPRYRPRENYSAELDARNGIPSYHWSGAMRRGLDIDSFTGVISGTPRSDAVRITFPVELCDHDPKSTCETRRLAILREEPDPPDPVPDTGPVPDPGPICPPGQVCAEPGAEPGEC